MAYAIDTNVENTTLDFVVFATRDEAQRAVKDVASMYSADSRFTIYETNEKATTTYESWVTE